MSCTAGQEKAARGAAANSIPTASSKGAYVAGSSGPTAAMPAGRSPQRRQRGRSRRKPTGRKKARQTAKVDGQSARGSTDSQSKKGTGQASFFETQAQPGPPARPGQIKLTALFNQAELQQLTVHLGLGAAAVTRHLGGLNSRTSRGIGYSDPRPLDWAKLDQRNYQFLAGQLRQACREEGRLDTTSLSKEELFDLWEFANFEAERAQRNIDHLLSGLSHLKRPTADHLAERHRLDARFYTFLTRQLQPLITPEMMEAYYVGL